MPVNRISHFVPSETAELAQRARPPAPTGKNSFAAKLAASASRVAQDQAASMTVEAPPSADEKREALLEMMREQSLMLSQQILGSAGSGPTLDSE
ncbi:MAG: hypothetical protein IRZ16_07740 [Myxococcaceae bacterium]|nr:hypothetical protein [Myxococcaceae bacterium]